MLDCSRSTAGGSTDGTHSLTIRWHLPRVGTARVAAWARPLPLDQRPLGIAQRTSAGCARRLRRYRLDRRNTLHRRPRHPAHVPQRLCGFSRSTGFSLTSGSLSISLQPTNSYSSRPDGRSFALRMLANWVFRGTTSVGWSVGILEKVRRGFIPLPSSRATSISHTHRGSLSPHLCTAFEKLGNS